jgi:membrane fusion protein, multidrug efflux system
MRYLSIAIILLLIGGAGWAGYQLLMKQPDPSQSSRGPGGPGGPGGRRSMRADGPAPVALTKAVKQSLPVYREGIGNVQALATITIRSQVDGRLLTVDFVEGQDVHKGDVLARIDPVVYKAQHDQAVAKKALDAANLANARIDLERYRKLAATNAGPKQQADQQAAQVAQLEAQIDADKAAIDNAKAVLDYCIIAAPIDGRMGLRLVDPGNVIHASDAGGIASITQIKPIAVVFTLPQRDFAVVTAALGKGEVRVEIPPGQPGTAASAGVLKSTDNQIDMTTGTIKLKAVFDNADGKLWPGQFVSVRVVVDTLVDATVVPSAAVRRGPSGNFVYVVGDDKKSVMTPVTVALQDETSAVIATGLNVGQSVVTEGFARLTDGAAVAVPDQDGTASSDGGGQGRPRRDKDGQAAADGGGQGDGSGHKHGDGRSGDGASGGWSGKKGDGEHKHRRRDGANGGAVAEEEAASPKGDGKPPVSPQGPVARP